MEYSPKRIYIYSVLFNPATIPRKRRLKSEIFEFLSFFFFNIYIYIYKIEILLYFNLSNIRVWTEAPSWWELRHHAFSNYIITTFEEMYIVKKVMYILILNNSFYIYIYIYILKVVWSLVSNFRYSQNYIWDAR